LKENIINVNNKLKITNNLLFNKKYLFFFFFLFPSTQIYITQGCSLHFFKSSRGVGVEIVERDNIL
jgi:hypothetical protein